MWSCCLRDVDEATRYKVWSWIQSNWFPDILTFCDNPHLTLGCYKPAMTSRIAIGGCIYQNFTASYHEAVGSVAIIVHQMITTL